jgi:hypothetical protein
MKEGYAGRIGEALNNFGKAALDHTGMHHRLKELWEIVGNQNSDIVDVDFNAYDSWRQKIQMKVNMENARRNRIKRRKEYSDDAWKTILRISKPQGGFVQLMLKKWQIIMLRIGK